MTGWAAAGIAAAVLALAAAAVWMLRRQHTTLDEPATEPEPVRTADDAAADAAVRAARARLRATRADQPRVAAAKRRLARRRQDNHFLELLTDIIRSVRP